MQRTASAWMAKRIKDELFAKPAPPPESEEPESSKQDGGGASEEVADDLDRRVLHDDDGRALGTAYRLRDVAVYVVFDGYGTPEQALTRSVDEPETELMVQSDGARITALIYVPDPNRAPARAAGLRADEV